MVQAWLVSFYVLLKHFQVKSKNGNDNIYDFWGPPDASCFSLYFILQPWTVNIIILYFIGGIKRSRLRKLTQIIQLINDTANSETSSDWLKSSFHSNVSCLLACSTPDETWTVPSEKWEWVGCQADLNLIPQSAVGIWESYWDSVSLSVKWGKKQYLTSSGC